MITLLLVAHGSPDEHAANRPAIEHAEQIRRWGSFDAVREAFVRGSPKVSDVVETIEHGEIIVVPLFESEGFFAGTVVPQSVEDARRTGVSVRYARPVGTHDTMTDIAFGRAMSALDDELVTDDHDEPVALALLGHGSTQSAENRNSVCSHASEIQNRGHFETVSAFFLEEQPRICALTSVVDTHNVVAVPMFMANGYHVREDIPRRIGFPPTSQSTRVTVEGHDLRYTEPVGTDPVVATIALERGISATDTDSSASQHLRFAPFHGGRDGEALRAQEGRT